MQEQLFFYVPEGRSTPYKFGRDLPLRARLLGSEEQSGFSPGTEVAVLQVEIGDTGDVLIGFVASADEGICLLHEIELIE